jgi:DNA-binding transcriptional ArsR family regulator
MSLESTRRSAPSDGESMLEEPELTDARAMRALAHPVRLSLIDLLGYHESLTATQASELIGESPTNCAFHLRTLAKYGFLREAATTSRRERPWTLVNHAVRINSRQADPRAAQAAAVLVQTMLERWLDRARRVFGSPSRVPGWHEATGWSQKHVFMTPDEARAAREEIHKVLDRYDDRQANPALCPPGAHPVEWTTFTAPIAEWAPGKASSPPRPEGETRP